MEKSMDKVMKIFQRSSSRKYLNVTAIFAAVPRDVVVQIHATKKADMVIEDAQEKKSGKRFVDIRTPTTCQWLEN